MRFIPLTFAWENSRILCIVFEFLVKMKRGWVIEGLRYQAAEVANIINANDEVVNSNVVIERPVQALWIIPAKNQKACRTVITLHRPTLITVGAEGRLNTYRDKESTEFLSEISMLSKSSDATKSCFIK